MDYKNKYYKYKNKYKELSKYMYGGNKNLIIDINGNHNYYYNDDTTIKDLIDFINKKINSKLYINEFILKREYNSEEIILNDKNSNGKVSEIFKYIKYKLMPPKKKIEYDETDKQIFTNLLIQVSSDKTFDKIIISEFSCNIESSELSIEKNILQQFQYTNFAGYHKNIVIILYDKIFFKNNYNIQFYELVENIVEVPVEENIYLNKKEKIKKFIYNNKDKEFKSKNYEDNYNNKYIFKLNNTEMQNKNITFYVLNYELITDDITKNNSAQEILKNNNIENIDIYNFEGNLVYTNQLKFM